MSTSNTTDLKEALKTILATRHSCRGYLPTPVDKATITSVLEDAQRSCSNCNTQPWHVLIVSGAKRDEYSKRLVEDWKANGLTGSGDFVFDVELFTGLYGERRREQGKRFYEAIALDRSDKEGRADIITENFRLYGAPHVALFFMNDIAEGNVRQAADVGQYAMTFMLSLVSHGLAGLPQTLLGMKPEIAREVFPDIPEGYKMLFGVSFGYEDHDDAANKFRMPRAPLEQAVVFYE